MPHLVSHFLLAMAAVMAAGRLMGSVFRRIHQPAVIGEVVGGILLGPSLLGALWPEAYRFLLPAEIEPLLRIVAEVGVVAYMFLVGVELDTGMLRGRVPSIAVIAAAGMATPFGFGVALAAYLYPVVSSIDVPFWTFALFFGVSLSVTAFPVLARILSDLRMTQTPLGVSALSCAAIADVSAWAMLAVTIGVAHATPDRFAIVAAFLAGAVIPHDSAFGRTLRGRLERLVVMFLLPAFFALTGMKTEIGLVSGWAGWALCVLIIAVATAGKLGGTWLAARLVGLAPAHAAGLAVLMNTRGLMEIVVLNIGLQLGVISPTLFTLLVIMAIVTTMAATPILRRIC